MDAYRYENLLYDIKSLKTKHPSVPVFSIGQSVEGRELYTLKLGSGSKRIYFNAAHHGMEWLTAKVLFAFAEDLASSPPSASVYLTPMVNPDGIEIAADGKGVFWQANARGVDLNHNYDALWDLSKQTSEVTVPSATRYGGEFPESEPETRAVANFTRQNKFDVVFALHSQGEVIYYDFCGIIPDGTEEYLRRFESVSRYRRDIPSGISSYGGYKDWFIKCFRKPGFTIEIGIGENPLPMSDFDTVYDNVRPILYEAIRL